MTTGIYDIELWLGGSKYEPPVETPMHCACGNILTGADERWMEICEPCQRNLFTDNDPLDDIDEMLAQWEGEGGAAP